jgi:hypothetical protein
MLYNFEQYLEKITAEGVEIKLVLVSSKSFTMNFSQPTIGGLLKIDLGTCSPFEEFLMFLLVS